MSDRDTLEAMAAKLQATGDYRVLRRLVRRPAIDTSAVGEDMRLGIMLDTETTGFDLKKDEIIELAMVPFAFTPEGALIGIGEPFHNLRQPRNPIPPEITVITGIDDAMVAGHFIDPAEVAAIVAPAHLIVAHHAAFDRPMVDKTFDAFAGKAWACSMSQVDWKAEGFESQRLGSIAADLGFFYDAHRAVDDCLAAIEILARPLLRSGISALAKLLEAARTPTVRIFAVNSPFSLKDALKARGYQWNDGSDGQAKSWLIDVPEDKADAEIAWLRAEIYDGSAVNLPTTRITAFSRFRAQA